MLWTFLLAWLPAAVVAYVVGHSVRLIAYGALGVTSAPIASPAMRTRPATIGAMLRTDLDRHR
jgi:hypothetical protein